MILKIVISQNYGKEIDDFWPFRKEIVPTEKATVEKFWYGSYSTETFADWQFDGILQTNVYWETWKNQKNATREEQQSRDISTH